MLSESFQPQVQAHLFDGTHFAKEVDIHVPPQHEMENCPCKSAMRTLAPEHLTADGHMANVNGARLRWPALHMLSRKGKKFGVPVNRQIIFAELDEGLEAYVHYEYEQSAVEEHLWGEYLCGARSARSFYGAFSRNNLGFSPS